MDKRSPTEIASERASYTLDLAFLEPAEARCCCSPAARRRRPPAAPLAPLARSPSPHTQTRAHGQFLSCARGGYASVRDELRRRPPPIPSRSPSYFWQGGYASVRDELLELYAQAGMQAFGTFICPEKTLPFE